MKRCDYFGANPFLFLMRLMFLIGVWIVAKVRSLVTCFKVHRVKVRFPLDGSWSSDFRSF